MSDSEETTGGRKGSAPGSDGPAAGAKGPAAGAKAPAAGAKGPAAGAKGPAAGGAGPAAGAKRPAAGNGAPPEEKDDGRSITRGRLIAVDALIVFASVLAIIAMLSVWTNRLLLNPDNWSNTSTQLLQNDEIRSATANYAVDQLYANVNVANLIKSGLPPRFAPLAGPAAGALQNAAVSGVELALTRPRIQAAWAKANRAADQTFVTIVNGGKGAVKINGGAVSLNLSAIVDQVAARLGLPPNLGAKLPASVANLTVFKSKQLKAVQDIGGAVKSLALWLTILVPLLYALAIFLARGHRRRTLMSVGFSFVLVGLIGIAGRSILETQITNSLTDDASLRPAIMAVVNIATGILGTIAGAFILVGIVLAFAAWFAGPARFMVAARRAIAPFLREQAAGSFAIVAGVMVLIFIWEPIPSTGTPVGIIVYLALALFGTEVLRRQAEEEFPDAQKGDATAAIRARYSAYRDNRQRAKAPPAPAPAAPTQSLPEQLAQLAALRNDGALTPDEYDAAKSHLIHA